MEKYFNKDTNKYHNIYDVTELDVTLLKDIMKCMVTKKLTKTYKKTSTTRYEQKQIGKNNSYINIPCSFDIETTSTDNGGFMYIWQFGLCDAVIIGRTWEEFKNYLIMLDDAIGFTKEKQSVICWVHNLGFEFQFMRGYLTELYSGDSFFKDTRKPLYVKYLHIMFKDSMAMTNSSLAKLAKDYCQTQKLKGDLDYDIPRSNKTVLTEQELAYCYNDVIILCEYAKDYWNRYIKNGTVPLTITSVLNNKVKKLYKSRYSRYSEETKFLKSCWFKDYDETAYFMKYGYRGGFVHAIQECVGIHYEEDANIVSYDITSSYPTVMLTELYPCKWVLSKGKTIKALEDYIKKNYVFYTEITFYNIKSTTLHSIESNSKCVELVNPVIDNGRVRCADKMRVVLLTPDWETYKEFYKWEDYEIHYIYFSVPMKLPWYLINPMIEYGALKNMLKKEGKPYAYEKSMFNSFYGLCCKGIEPVMTKFDGKDFYESDNLNWDKITDGVLLPQWGAFVSAYARRNLLSMVYNITKAGCECIYMDTDSIKILNFNDDILEIINKYNTIMNSRIKDALEFYQVQSDYANAISDLGEFDCEGSIKEFKTLGAKRYIYVSSPANELHQTIAGLPKTALMDKYHDIQECFNQFNNDLEIIECGKLTSIYYDEETTDIIDGVRMYSKSSISLQKCDFTLKLDENWLNNIPYFQAIIQVAKEKKW